MSLHAVRLFCARHARTLVLIGALLVVGVLLLFQSDGPFGANNLPEVRELAGKEFSFQQYSTYFRNLAEDKGGAYAYQVLLRADLKPGTDIHLVAHVIGDILYLQEGIEGIYTCTQDFRNACSHAVVIGILNEHGEGILPEIAETCRKAPGGRGAYTMCFHGLGHGVLAYNGYKYDQAVEMCKTVGTPEFQDREYIECVGGATMEMVAGVHDRAVWEKEVKNYFKESDPLYPCDASFMPAAVQPICYIHLTPRLFQAAGVALGKPDPELYDESFAFCDRLPENDYRNREACYGGFGKEFTVLAQGRDIRSVGEMEEEQLIDVRSWCARAGNESGEKNCTGYALASLFWGGENPIDASLRFCAIAEGEAKDTCYQQLADHVQYYLGGELQARELCAQLPHEYQDQCQGRP